MRKITNRFEKMMLISMGVSLIDVIVGVLFIVCTSFSTKVNMVILGATILVHGLFYVIRYLYDGLGKKVFSVDLISGVASIILGVFTIFNTFDPLSVLGILFCIWLFISGGEKLYYGILFYS